MAATTPPPASAEADARSGRVARNAALISTAQVATMATGGVLAVLVAALIGNDARTDGFFAAYGIYAMGVVFAQSTRTTVVARLLEGDSRFGALDRYLGGAALIAALSVVLLGPLGGVVADVVTGDLPEAASDVARTALALLAPAIALQLFAALGAAMLGALGDFLVPGLAFLGGSLLSVVVFVALEPSLGIDGVAVALLAGSVASAAVIAIALFRAGWRPSRAMLVGPPELVRAAAVLIVASLSILIAHFGYLVTLSVGARLGEGVITAFSYAYLGFGLVFALLAGSIPMAIIGPLAQHWDRRPQSLVEHNEVVFRAGLLLLVPVVATVWLVGQEVGGVLLAKFTAAEVDLTVDLFLLLSPVIFCGLVQAVPYAAVLIAGRYTAIAVATAIVVAIQVGITLVAAAADSPRLLAVAFPIANTVNLVAALVLVSRTYPKMVAGPLARGALPMLLLAASAFGIPAALAHALDGPAGDWVALGVGLVLYAVALGALRPVERELAGRVVRTVLPGRT